MNSKIRKEFYLNPLRFLRGRILLSFFINLFFSFFLPEMGEISYLVGWSLSFTHPPGITERAKKMRENKEKEFFPRIDEIILRGFKNSKGRMPLTLYKIIPLSYYLFWFRDYNYYLLTGLHRPNSNSIHRRRGIPHGSLLETLSSQYLFPLFSLLHLLPFLLLQYLEKYHRDGNHFPGDLYSQIPKSLGLGEDSSLFSLWEIYHGLILFLIPENQKKILLFLHSFARLYYFLHNSQADILAHFSSIHRSLLPELCERLDIPFPRKKSPTLPKKPLGPNAIKSFPGKKKPI